MTHYKLPDYRINSLHDLLHGLKHSFKVIHEKLERIDWYDGLWAKEESEFLLGIAFLGSQNYIHNTKQDFNRMVEMSEFTKSDFQDSDIDFIWTVSNYFKHHESWKEDWRLEKKACSQPTIQALEASGINENTEFRCYKAYSLLFGENDIGVFSQLEQKLVSWRSNLEQQLRSCIK